MLRYYSIAYIYYAISRQLKPSIISVVLNLTPASHLATGLHFLLCCAAPLNAEGRDVGEQKQFQYKLMRCYNTSL